MLAKNIQQQKNRGVRRVITADFIPVTIVDPPTQNIRPASQPAPTTGARLGLSSNSTYAIRFKVGSTYVNMDVVEAFQVNSTSAGMQKNFVTNKLDSDSIKIEDGKIITGNLLNGAEYLLIFSSLTANYQSIVLAYKVF